jgi:hypothetical protein
MVPHAHMHTHARVCAHTYARTRARAHTHMHTTGQLIRKCAATTRVRWYSSPTARSPCCLTLSWRSLSRLSRCARMSVFLCRSPCRCISDHLHSLPLSLLPPPPSLLSCSRRTPRASRMNTHARMRAHSLTHSLTTTHRSCSIAERFFLHGFRGSSSAALARLS